VETAIATKRQMAADGEHSEVATVAAGTLRVIANSISAAGVARLPGRPTGQRGATGDGVKGDL
jgi:hypothetical protein